MRSQFAEPTAGCSSRSEEEQRNTAVCTQISAFQQAGDLLHGLALPSIKAIKHMFFFDDPWYRVSEIGTTHNEARIHGHGVLRGCWEDTF